MKIRMKLIDFLYIALDNNVHPKQELIKKYNLDENSIKLIKYGKSPQRLL